MKIKFAELFQNTWIIYNLLEFMSMYQKNINLYNTKFSNDILNLKFYLHLPMVTANSEVKAWGGVGTR